MAIDKIHFPDNKSRDFYPYKGWIVEEQDGSQVKDILMVRSQDLGPLERLSVRPKDPYSHWTCNLMDKNNLPILPKNCRKISWYPQGYYIAYYDNEDDIYDHSIGGFHTEDFIAGYWVVKEDGTLLSDKLYLKAEPATFNRVFVTEKRRKYILSLDGTEHPIPSISPIGVSGWYIFGNGVDCKIIDNNGNVVMTNVEVITYDSEIFIVRKGNKFLVYDYNRNVIGSEFTSLLYSEGDIWNIQLCHLDNPKVTYLYGQTKNGILQYAQQVLVSDERLALLEKDGLWYYYDAKHQLVECFKFNPKDIILPQ